MHYWRQNNAATGPQGSGGHYFFTNNALAGILISIACFVKELSISEKEFEFILAHCMVNGLGYRPLKLEVHPMYS